MNMRDLVEDLEKRRAVAKEMGGERRITRQHEKGKLTARERLGLLLDDGSFQELGTHGTHHSGFTPIDPAKAACDGVICGTGHIDGRLVACALYDFTVMGGSIGYTGEVKVTRMREVALRGRMPMVWLVDSGGARISGGKEDMERICLFADTGYLFREQVTMSGVVPQVAAMVGPGAAGTAYIPGLADFVPMVKKTSSMALGGPALVKAVTGKEISEQDLGGAKLHNETSGVADLLVKSDEDCIAAVREYLSFMPSHCGDKPPRGESADPADRMEEALLDVLPENPRAVYDMRKLIALVVDDGHLFEIKPRFAKNIVTGFARMAGEPVGVVANNPRYWGGILDVDAADKSARFVNLCDAFNIPLVFLVDVPGFMVGVKTEEQGLIRHGAKMLYAVSEATVPKVTVVVRKAYGAGYYVMCGRAYEPDLLVAWPSAEISVMGAEGMVGISARKMLDAADDPDALMSQLAGVIRPHIDIYRSAGHGYVDEVIDPRETRPAIIRGLEMGRNKVVERPWRRNGVRPV